MGLFSRKNEKQPDIQPSSPDSFTFGVEDIFHAESGNEVIVTKNGKEVGRFIPRESAVSYLTDSLTGILKSDMDIAQAKEERLKEKYAITD